MARVRNGVENIYSRKFLPKLIVIKFFKFYNRLKKFF